MLNDYLSLEVLYSMNEKFNLINNVHANDTDFLHHLKNEIYNILSSLKEPFFIETPNFNDFCFDVPLTKLLRDFLNNNFKFLNSQEMKHYTYVLQKCIHPMSRNYFNHNCLLMYFNYHTENHNKMLHLINQNYYVYFYLINTLCNLFRVCHGYYFSAPKNEYVIMNDNKNYKKKIIRQYNKCFLIVDEFDNYIKSFFEFWVKYTMNSLYGYKLFYNFRVCLNLNINLQSDVNNKYRFLKHRYDFFYLKTKRINKNYNFEIFDFLIIHHDLYNIFHNYLQIYCPESTDEFGIPYEYDYIPLPIL